MTPRACDPAHEGHSDKAGCIRSHRHLKTLGFAPRARVNVCDVCTLSRIVSVMIIWLASALPV